MTKENLTKEAIARDLFAIRKNRFAVIRTVFLLTFVPLHLIALGIIWLFQAVIGKILFYIALGLSVWYLFEIIRYAVYKKSVKDGKYILETASLTSVEEITVVESKSRHSVIRQSVPHLCFGDRTWRIPPMGYAHRESDGADRESVRCAASVGDTYFVVSKTAGSPILCAYNAKDFSWEDRHE